MFLLKEWLGIGISSQGKWWSHHLRRHLDVALGTWFRGNYGGVGLTAGLDILRGLFQPGWFCYSAKMSSIIICHQRIQGFWLLIILQYWIPKLHYIWLVTHAEGLLILQRIFFFLIFGSTNISTATCSQNLSAGMQTKPQKQLLAKGVKGFALLVILAFGIVITLMAKAAVKWWLNL